MRHPGPFDGDAVGVHVAVSRPALLPGTPVPLHRHPGMHRMHMHCWAAGQGGWPEGTLDPNTLAALPHLSFPAAGAAPAR